MARKFTFVAVLPPAINPNQQVLRKCHSEPNIPWHWKEDLHSLNGETGVQDNQPAGEFSRRIDGVRYLISSDDMNTPATTFQTSTPVSHQQRDEEQSPETQHVHERRINREMGLFEHPVYPSSCLQVSTNDPLHNLQSSALHNDARQKAPKRQPQESSDAYVPNRYRPALTHREAAKKKVFERLQSDVDEDKFLNSGTCCGKCLDVCTGSCKRCQTNIMTNALRKARTKGWKMIAIVLFPLLQDIVRDVWVATELITVLLGLILSIAAFTHSQIDIFNSVHLTLSILAGILATIDAIYTLKQCKSCKKCCCDYRIRDKADEVKGKCHSCLKNTFDIIRLIIAEIIFYPLLICDIFEVITGQAHEGKGHIDRLSFSLFILSCISLILYIYVARIIVIICIIKNVMDARTPTTEWKKNLPSQVRHDPIARRSALRYLVYFFIHMVLQMVVQLFMLVAIAAKIRYDNSHLYELQNSDESIHASGPLWYMLIFGYVAPIMGFSTFFIVTYYWTQEFPIGFYLDMVSLFAMTTLGPDELVHMNRVAEEKKQMTEKMLSQFEKVKTDFRGLYAEKWYYKFAYPFKAPVLILLCLGFAGLHLGFTLCAALTLNEDGDLKIQLLNGGDWQYYFAATTILMFLANAYVSTVATFWSIIFALVVGLIALIISVIAAAVAIALGVIVAGIALVVGLVVAAVAVILGVILVGVIGAAIGYIVSFPFLCCVRYCYTSSSSTPSSKYSPRCTPRTKFSSSPSNRLDLHTASFDGPEISMVEISHLVIMGRARGNSSSPRGSTNSFSSDSMPAQSLVPHGDLDNSNSIEITLARSMAIVEIHEERGQTNIAKESITLKAEGKDVELEFTEETTTIQHIRNQSLTSTNSSLDMLDSSLDSDL